MLASIRREGTCTVFFDDPAAWILVHLPFPIAAPVCSSPGGLRIWNMVVSIAFFVVEECIIASGDLLPLQTVHAS